MVQQQKKKKRLYLKEGTKERDKERKQVPEECSWEEKRREEKYLCFLFPPPAQNGKAPGSLGNMLIRSALLTALLEP